MVICTQRCYSEVTNNVSTNAGLKKQGLVHHEISNTKVIQDISVKHRRSGMR